MALTPFRKNTNLPDFKNQGILCQELLGIFEAYHSFSRQKYLLEVFIGASSRSPFEGCKSAKE
jgi:hypothetical protein